jgi:hypothetical protein
MPYIAGTDQPVNAFVRCPRCRVPRMMTGLADDLNYVCSGCEWPMTMGAGASPLSTSAGVSAGAVSLPFAAGGTQFSAGQLLFISDAGLSETVTVAGPPTATAVPVTPTMNAHATAKAVSVAVAAPTLANQEANPNTTN